MPELPPNDLDLLCPHCEGLGMRIVTSADGRNVAQPCECRRELRSRRVMQKANIPRRYEHCTLDSYLTTVDPPNRALFRAKGVARRFVDDYHPIQNTGQGLLITGMIGVGKTHLAVGILRELIETRGASGLFCDYRELLKQVQNSYNPRVAATELEVLAPVFEAEVLILDEIRASKPTEWVWDTVAHILNTRYNDRLTTILTTNYSNSPPAAILAATRASDEAQAAVKDESLGDRIGERMRSRLQEMCTVVQVDGEDWRQRHKRAPKIHAKRFYRVLSPVHIGEYHFSDKSFVELAEDDAEDYLRQGKITLATPDMLR